MEHRILGLIFVCIGAYFFFVAIRVSPTSKDPDKIAEYLEKWGLL